MDENIGYKYCDICKRYYIDVFYEPHIKICRYVWINNSKGIIR